VNQCKIGKRDEELSSETQRIVLIKFDLICSSRLIFSKYKPRKALEVDICVGINNKLSEYFIELNHKWVRLFRDGMVIILCFQT